MKNLNFLFVFGFIAILGTSCASLTGFETGRTVGESNGEFAFSINAAQTPDFDIDTFGSTPQFWAPNLEFGGKFGVSEKVDVGIRVNSNLNVLLDGKFQVVGDSESEFALAVGAGIGAFGLFIPNAGLYNFQIPVYASFHPKEKVSLYLSPRYIGQFGVGAGETSDLASYYGANGGVLFGRKTKFGIDFGYYGLNANDVNNSLFQVGIGMKFRFGDRGRN